MAPTKAFNLAGLQTAAVAVPNPNLRHKVWRGLNTDEVAEPNSFAVEAAVAAFTKGEAWLDSLREYIQENKKFCGEFFEERGFAYQAGSFTGHLSFVAGLPGNAGVCC